MKTCVILHYAMLAVLLLTTSSLQALDATYNNVTVTGTGDFQGPSAMFGTWSGGGGGAGLTLNFTDGTMTTVNFIGSGTSTIWQWSQYIGSGSPYVSLKLDQNNQLILYTSGTSGTAGVTLNPAGTSSFAGSVTINGTNSTLPNQVLVGGSSILTESLGDARYLLLSATSGFVSNSNFAIGTGTASGSYSGAIGDGPVASGSASMAQGYQTTASGVYSAAFGNNTTAQGFDQFVVGQYNAPQGASDSSSGTNAIFVVGNGSGTDSLSNAMVVLQNGNVGIGTSQPSNALDVNGVFRNLASTAFPSSNVGLETFYLPGQFGVIQAYDRDNSTYVPMAFAGYQCYFFSGQASVAMYIDETGNVGIGTTSPAAMLDVEGSGRFTGPVHLEPQGDLDMGDFTSDPDSGGGGEGGDSEFRGGMFGGMGGGGSSGTTSGTGSH